MPAPKVFPGDKYHYWTVIEYDKTSRKFLCQCVCGKSRLIQGYCLTAETSKSCGCQKKELFKESCIKKYGVENLSQSQEIKDKKANTCLEKYGVSTHLQTEEQKLHRFGPPKPPPPVLTEEEKIAKEELRRSRIRASSKVAIKKRKRRCLEEHGVDCHAKLQWVKDKREASFIRKYGGFPLSDESIRGKAKDTVKQKYGVDHPWKIPGSISKGLETKFKKYKRTRFCSNGEAEIAAYVESLGFKTTKKGSKSGEIDIYIPDLNLGIEYNGGYWHSETRGKGRSYHLDKLNLANSQGIDLLHIWDFWWLRRKEQVKNLLHSKLGLSNRVYARKCSFLSITSEEAVDFVNKNHIQELKSKPILSLGAFYEGGLVSVATFSRHHRGLDEICLNRFCSSYGVTVVGGLSKFSKMASVHFQKEIVSWADRCISNARGYLSSGWKVVSILPPDYFYVDGQVKMYPKQSRQKSIVKTPEGMTEYEHALKDGLFRVWDCGKIKLISPACFL
jgi:hypothetical protein